MIEEEKATILVVDDSISDRLLLEKIFTENSYNVILAENGKVALELLAENPKIKLVVLDLMMPVFDGYEVLKMIQKQKQLNHIPIVVVTSNEKDEDIIKTLDAGAVDVILKPYNPKIVLHRIANIIYRDRLKKLEIKQLIYQERIKKTEIDSMTGFYNKQAFCYYASEFMKKNPMEKYIIFRWNINKFKVFNDLFGFAEGNKYLVNISKKYHDLTKDFAINGRWEGDNFVSCMSKQNFESQNVMGHFEAIVNELNNLFELTISQGLYEVENLNIDVELMCDRALLALRSIKGNYTKRFAYYNQEMRSKLLEEQELVNDMKQALNSGQFQVYYQPQYNYASKTLRGAEALVRWIHPVKGMIPPLKFIPLFENNGFITQLDEYVWDLVCKFQRSCLDSGKNPIPISVNISRIDLYNPHLFEYISDLIKKYNLSKSLLRLEITESAYMNDTQQMILIVERLRSSGFSVEMDDFGSGYSSLNTLKDVSVDMLKLDMKFMEMDNNSARSGSIVSSIIRMAQLINLPIIAEGVETQEQADFLKSFGCIYMQGYYFSRPIPVEEFEKVLSLTPIDFAKQSVFNSSFHHVEDFFSSSTQAALLFNSFVGGAAILEYMDNNVEIIRSNDNFFDVLGTTREEYFSYQQQVFLRYDEQNKKLFLDALNQSYEENDESSCVVKTFGFSPDYANVWLKLRVRYLAKNNNRKIYYVSIENITNEKELNQHNEKLNRKLENIFKSLPGGILNLEITDKIRISHFNEMTASMFGYTMEEYKSLFAESPLEVIHPDDRSSLREKIQAIYSKKEKTLSAIYRHICSDGGWRYVHLVGRIFLSDDGQSAHASAMLLYWEG